MALKQIHYKLVVNVDEKDFDKGVLPSIKELEESFKEELFLEEMEEQGVGEVVKLSVKVFPIR